MSLKQHGIKKYKRIIAQNINQASYLGELIKQEHQLELMATVSLNIVCYRFNSDQISDKKLNEVNKEILMRIHESGIAAPSYTHLEDNYVIRVSITNHRTRKKDLNSLVEASINIGNRVLEDSIAK